MAYEYGMDIKVKILSAYSVLYPSVSRLNCRHFSNLLTNYPHSLSFPMYALVGLFLAFVATACAAGPPDESACKPFPSSMLEFSAQFEQPKPPSINPEFNTSFIQHKWYVVTISGMYHSSFSSDDSFIGGADFLRNIFTGTRMYPT